MFNFGMKKRFDRLVEGLAASGVIKDTGDPYYASYTFERITGRYGISIMVRHEMLLDKVNEQQKTINMLMKHLNLEVHNPDCSPVLRKKPKK